MATAQNAHGLSRNIPADIAREVRQRSKFGCVLCRKAICQYEHIKPEFKDATIHSAESICLLCYQCHGKVTKGIIAKKTVVEAYQRVQISDEVHRPFDEFDLNSNALRIVLGSSIFHRPKALIELDGETILAIEPPENGSSFPTLTGIFSDRSGREVLKIERNVWSSPISTWDVESKGNEIIVRQGRGNVALHLIANPPDEIVIQKLDMYLGSAHLCLRKNSLAIGRISEDLECYLEIGRLECIGARIGVQATKMFNVVPILTNLTIKGGEGIELQGTGLRLAVDSGPLTVRDLVIEIATRQYTQRRSYPLTTNLFGTTEYFPTRL